MHRRLFLGTTLTAGLVGALVVLRPFQAAKGQEMRIETEVFSGNSNQPIFENITLFSGSSVFDFSQTGPEKVTVYDRARGKFILLDVDNETKVVLDEKTVDRYVELLKSRKQLADKEPFLFDPEFKESYDDASNELTLSSDEMTYRIKGTPAKAEQAFQAYVEFANWYSKLSATDPRQMPPFPRLEANKAISRHQLIPREVERIYRPRHNVFGKTIRAKTKHYVIWKLSRKDRQRMDEALDHITSFREVSLAEFYGLEATTASR